MPALLIRVDRDQAYIDELAKLVAALNEKVRQTLEAIQKVIA